MKPFDDLMTEMTEKYMEHFHLEDPNSPAEIRNIIMFAQTYLQYNNLRILDQTYKNNLQLDKFFKSQETSLDN